MNKRLQQLKHWQLFAVFFIIPVILLFSYLVCVISSNELNKITTHLNVFSSFILLITIVSTITLGTCYAWFWSIGIGFRRKFPKGIVFNYKLFKVAVIFPVIYLIGLPLIIYFFTDDFCMINTQNVNAVESSYLLLIPLHFFSLFCSMYCVYFTAKTMKAIELQREPSFKEFSFELVLILFFFIGVWFIQPKVNAIEKIKDRY